MKPADIATLARGERTRQIILNAAEILFADLNYDAISIRNVAEKAGLQFGLITYHFKNKENLFEAVATRRSLEINQRRAQALAAVDQSDVGQILDAFIRPVIELLPLPEWRPYLRVVGQINKDARWSGLAARLFRDASMEFIVAIHRAMPHLSAETVARGFTYALSVLAGVTEYGPAMNALTSEAYAVDDSKRVLSTMLPFVTAGMLALADDEGANSSE